MTHAYKTLLVHLDVSRRVGPRLDLAFALADRFDAHLVGQYAVSAPAIPSYAMAEAGPALRDAIARRQGEAAAATEAAFRAVAARNGRGAKSEWRAWPGRDPVWSVRLSARYADLVVLGQPDPEDEQSMPLAFAEDVVLTSGRPTLFLPYAGEHRRVGERVLVAWNAGREATRAVTDALPFLVRAREVHVISFNPRGADHGEMPGADIGTWLARHGVNVLVDQQESLGVDVGNQILSRAADLDIDLVVAGAYGHARMRELILGGVTRTLLETMTVPVLMSH